MEKVGVYKIEPKIKPNRKLNQIEKRNSTDGLI